jgi:hypothetical protein
VLPTIPLVGFKEGLHHAPSSGRPPSLSGRHDTIPGRASPCAKRSCRKTSTRVPRRPVLHDRMVCALGIGGVRMMPWKSETSSCAVKDSGDVGQSVGYRDAVAALLVAPARQRWTFFVLPVNSPAGMKLATQQTISRAEANGIAPRLLPRIFINYRVQKRRPSRRAAQPTPSNAIELGSGTAGVDPSTPSR